MRPQSVAMLLLYLRCEGQEQARLGALFPYRIPRGSKDIDNVPLLSLLGLRRIFHKRNFSVIPSFLSQLSDIKYF